MAFVGEFTLPSGRVATFRKGKGKDYMRAQRYVIQDKAVEPGGYTLGLIAQLVEIDGKPIVFEDVLEMDIDDVEAMSGKLMEGKALNFTTPPALSSARSSSSDSEPKN